MTSNEVQERALSYRIGNVGVIQLNRPEKHNAISQAVLDSILAALDVFEGPDSDVRVLLIRSTGKNFSAGGDLKEAKTLLRTPGGLLRHFNAVERILERLESSQLPVVAACQGLSLAGGLELALACDIVFAAADAQFGDQHIASGLVPAWGGTQRLPRKVGLGRALDLMFSGRWIDAELAQTWGLVQYLSEPASLHDDALAYCKQLSTRSPEALAAMKQLARSAAGSASLVEGLQLEREIVFEVMEGKHSVAGIDAFNSRSDSA